MKTTNYIWIIASELSGNQLQKTVIQTAPRYTAQMHFIMQKTYRINQCERIKKTNNRFVHEHDDSKICYVASSKSSTVSVLNKRRYAFSSLKILAQITSIVY